MNGFLAYLVLKVFPSKSHRQKSAHAVCSDPNPEAAGPVGQKIYRQCESVPDMAQLYHSNNNTNTYNINQC